MLNLTRWTIAHRRIVVVAWIVLAVGACSPARRRSASATPTTSRCRTPTRSAPSTCCRAASRRRRATPTRSSSDARSGTRRPTPAVRRVIAPMLAQIAQLPHVAGVVEPLRRPARTPSRRTARIAFATVEFDERAERAAQGGGRTRDRHRRAARSAALQVELGGQAIEQTQQAGLGFADRRRARSPRSSCCCSLRLAARDGAADRHRAVRARHRARR